MNSLILITLDLSLFLFTELVAVFGLVVTARTIVLHGFHKASVTQRKNVLLFDGYDNGRGHLCVCSNDAFCMLVEKGCAERLSGLDGFRSGIGQPEAVQNLTLHVPLDMMPIVF